MEHRIRTVRADDWPRIRELRLAALRDPVAPIAFLETYATAAAHPDGFWQDRARMNAEGTSAVTFVAEGPDGEWAGSVTVLVELPGAEAAVGEIVSVPQAHIVGVFVRPEHRGTGLAGALFCSAIDWAWALSAPRVERVCLYVHERNERAEAFYRKLGFTRTGATTPAQNDPTALEYELALIARAAYANRP